jgi:uncharacterized protein (TIGR02453 family)
MAGGSLTSSTWGKRMSFDGWPAEALEFYEGLEADNSKSYWTANKALYDQAVHAPMAALLTELEEEFGEGKIFRPYRDLRFSADKTPYKTHVGATLAEGGYLQLSAQGLAAASGMYQMARDQLGRYRDAVADDKPGGKLVAIVAKAQRGGIDVHGSQSLKTAPRGYLKDHPRIELLKHKGLYAWRQWPVDPWLGTAEARKHVTTFLLGARPLQDWLDTYVGESTLPRDR